LKHKWRWDAAGAYLTVISVIDWWLLAAGGWLTWRGIFLRWTPIGLCLFAAAQWHLHNKEQDRKGLPRTASQWQMNIYCSLPLRLLSRCWGWLAECQVPRPVRPVLYGLYSSTFGVNLEEAAVPDLKHYRSLAEFFARSLKEDARTIDENCCLVSPCDGKVLHFGSAVDSNIEQVKGVSYSLEAFLGPKWKDHDRTAYAECLKHKNSDTALYQCIIYLAPGDYHRFHSPTSWKPEIRRHFHGELLSVSPKIAQWVPGLFCLNERALYIGQWEHGFFSFTAVGATNVGSVQIYVDEELKTNKWLGLTVGTLKSSEYDEVKLPADVSLRKGELVGQFNMGSTIVLIFEAPKNFKFNLTPGQRVRVGESLGCFVDEKTTSQS
jgi:phosphatidylserine decarboxylase